jgi:molybdopterin synthase catalytic subunit
VKTWITSEPLDAAMLLREVASPDHGAVVLFLGTVRRENDHRAVRGMRYDAYQAMAEGVLHDIAREVVARWNASRLAAAHRIGELNVGEVSVAIAISTPHRADAFAAARYMIEEIKKRLPVWKREHYESGEQRWLAGQAPPVRSGQP